MAVRAEHSAGRVGRRWLRRIHQHPVPLPAHRRAAARHQRYSRGCGQICADEPPAARRCRVGQDRGRTHRPDAGRCQWQTGRAHGADGHPRGTALPQHQRRLRADACRTAPASRPSSPCSRARFPAASAKPALAGIADGSIDIVIGTHALIQEGVEYHDLALAVIDEQHRFGVEQRRALRGKGTNPHLLVMTATPIPRTLALTMYADLDLSVIDEMPPGRIPVKTRVIEPVHRERAYNFIEGQLEQGRQAFIVYPLVEASESIDAGAAVEAFEDLKRVFFHHKVGLLHGRMKPAEKDAVMEDFRNHVFDVLVTTSVAEVGVDIPNASVILIEGANRFGLAQLHQFRGRVGRGDFASFCLLLCDTHAHRSARPPAGAGTDQRRLRAGGNRLAAARRRRPDRHAAEWQIAAAAGRRDEARSRRTGAARSAHALRR